MKVRYRANGRVAEVSEAAAKQLIAARICEPCEPVESDAPPPKGRKPR
jgi:hypothetical protein